MESIKRKKLAATLYGCNFVFELLIKMYGEHIEFLEMYVDYLDKHSNTYANVKLDKKYDVVRAHISIYKTQNLVKEHWKQINPYFRKEYAQEDLLAKDLTVILDDFFDNIVKVCPEHFLIPLGNERFKYLVRGRREKWHFKHDLCAPSIKVAKANNLINRWNPPSKRYLYLVSGNGTSEDIETVCEELRIKSGDTVTLADFNVCATTRKGKIIDLNYENISREDIFGFVDTVQNEHINEVIKNITEGGVHPTKEYIKQQIRLQDSQTKMLASTFAGKLLLKEISDAIFVPLDQIEDNDKNEKEKCYKSFHVLAEYLENKGYAGICYPSTRMKLIGKKGSNVVLFNADSAEPILDTLRVMVK